MTHEIDQAQEDEERITSCAAGIMVELVRFAEDKRMELRIHFMRDVFPDEEDFWTAANLVIAEGVARGWIQQTEEASHG